MLNKAGAAILTSPFSSFLLSPFVYLRLISHLFIYLFFLCLPSHSSPMYVNCVMPFNSNSGLQRALNEQSTSKHAAARLFSSSRRTLRLTPSPCPPLPSLHKGAPTDSAPNTANCSRRDVNSPQQPPPPRYFRQELKTERKKQQPPLKLRRRRGNFAKPDGAGGRDGAGVGSPRPFPRAPSAAGSPARPAAVAFPRRAPLGARAGCGATPAQGRSRCAPSGRAASAGALAGGPGEGRGPLPTGRRTHTTQWPRLTTDCLYSKRLCSTNEKV